MSRMTMIAKCAAFSGILAAASAASAIDIPISRPQDADAREWHQQILDFRMSNPMAGTVIIGNEHWTPEMQAAEPNRFAAAYEAMMARTSSAAYQDARREEAELRDEAHRAHLLKKDVEDAEERARRLAHMQFIWQAIAGRRIAEVAHIIRLREGEAAAAAAMNAKVIIPTTPTVVPESPGEQAQRLLAPERKVRFVQPTSVEPKTITRVSR